MVMPDGGTHPGLVRLVAAWGPVRVAWGPVRVGSAAAESTDYDTDVRGSPGGAIILVG